MSSSPVTVHPAVKEHDFSIINVDLNIPDSIIGMIKDKVHDEIQKLNKEEQEAVLVRLCFPGETPFLWAQGIGIPFWDVLHENCFNIAYGRNAAKIYNAPDNWNKVAIYVHSDGYAVVTKIKKHKVTTDVDNGKSLEQSDVLTLPGILVDRCANNLIEALVSVMEKIIPKSCPAELRRLRHCGGYFTRISLPDSPWDRNVITNVFEAVDLPVAALLAISNSYKKYDNPAEALKDDKLIYGSYALVKISSLFGSPAASHELSSALRNHFNPMSTVVKCENISGNFNFMF